METSARVRLQQRMTFNEANVNRDQGGKFDTKTGSFADTTLVPNEADEKYTAAYAKYWDEAMPAYSAARETAQDSQLGLVTLDIAQAGKGIVRAEVLWDDEWEALGRPSKFYDADGNEVDLEYETDNSLDLFDDHDSIRHHPSFTETEGGFSFEVADVPHTDPEYDSAYNDHWGHDLDRLNAAQGAVQEAQLDLVRAEIAMEDPRVVTAEIEWDSEWDALGRPSRFYDAEGNEVDLGVETDTSLDMWDDFDNVRRDPNFTETENGFRFNIRPE